METVKIKINPQTSQERVFEVPVPEFQGSEKQVSWARDIYIKNIYGLCNMVANGPENDKIRAQYEMALGKLSSITDARFWIEHRCESWQDIYKSI